MKRIQEVIKPFLSIIFGALILLYFMNFLQIGGVYLAVGIIAMVLAAFYLGVGVVGLVASTKLSSSAKRVFDLGSIVGFPIFMFVLFLLSFINTAQNIGVDNIGPTGWVLLVLKLAASITFPTVYILAEFVNHKTLNRLSLVFAATFVLALLCEILFDITGFPTGLGNIIIIEFALYFIYCNMLFSSIKAPAKEQATQESKEEEPEEEVVEEPAEENEESKENEESQDSAE